MNKLDVNPAAKVLPPEGGTAEAASATAPSSISFVQPATVAGLAIAFGTPFLVGASIRIAASLGADLDGAVLTVRLVTALAEIAALIGVVCAGERRTLGSVGFRPPTAEDFRTGLGIAAGCFLLAILIPSIAGSASSDASAPIISRVRVLFPANALPLYRGTFAYAAIVIAFAAIAQELAMRGFAASRLRTFTGSALIGGAVALLLDLLANLPLWGFAYAIEIAPVEALLVGLFLSKRRLLPCVVANFALGLFALMLAAVAGTPAGSPATPGHGPLEAAALSKGEEVAIENLNRTLGAADPAAQFLKRASEDANRGDYDQAEAEIGKAIAAEPKSPILYLYRGDLYAAQNRHDPAIADYGKAVELLPKEASPYRRRGNEYVRAGNDLAAHRDLANAIALQPDNPDGYIDRSALYVRETRYKEAVRDIDQALKLAPNQADYLLRRSRVFELMHQYDQAIADCNRVIAINASWSGGYACRAQEETVKGDRTQAIADLGEVLKRAPNSQEALVARADLEMQLGQWSAARADLVALSQINSVDGETADWAAWPLATSVYPQLRDGKAAVALATRACEATGFKDQKYLETLAASYAESGDFAQAVRWQQRAIQVASDLTVARFLQWQLGNYQKGVPYREDESGPVTRRSAPRLAAALLASMLALVGLVTLIVVLVRLARAGLRRATA
jgi:tetratricopeptide (TPR) repeat protein